MWQRLMKPATGDGEHNPPPPPPATGTSASITPTTERSRKVFKKPDLSALKKTNEQMKDWLSARTASRNHLKRGECLASVTVGGNVDEPPPSYTPSTNVPRGSTGTAGAASAPANQNAGSLPHIPQPSAANHTANLTPAAHRASAPVPSSNTDARPPPYSRTDPRAETAQTKSLTIDTRRPLQRGPSGGTDNQILSTAEVNKPITGAVEKASEVSSPRSAEVPYSTFARLNLPPSDAQLTSPTAKPPGDPSVRDSSIVNDSDWLRKQRQHSDAIESEYTRAMDDYFDDFFDMTAMDVDPPAAKVEPLLPAPCQKSSVTQMSSTRRSQASTHKDSINSWYRPASSFHVSDAGDGLNVSPNAAPPAPAPPQQNGDNAANAGKTEHTSGNTAARVRPSAGGMPRVDSDLTKGYPALSVFRTTRIKARPSTDAAASGPHAASSAGVASPPSAQHRPSASLSSTSEVEEPLMRTNDLMPSKWAYVALFATKVKEARETKLRVSRLRRGRPTAPPSNHSRDQAYDTVAPSVFALGRIEGADGHTDEDGEEEDEEVELSEVCDDEGNRLAEPTLSLLWADCISDTEPSDTEDLHVEESEGFELDNMPSMFPATRIRPPAPNSPEDASHTPAQNKVVFCPAGRVPRSPPSGASRPQCEQAPHDRASNGSTPFVRPNMQAALAAQQQQKQKQWAQRHDQNPQQARYGQATPGFPPPRPPALCDPRRQQQRPQQPQPPRPPLSGPAPGEAMVKTPQNPGPAAPGYASSFYFCPQIPPPAPQPNIRGPKLQGRRPPPADFARLYGWRLSDATWVDSPTLSPRAGVRRDKTQGRHNKKNAVDKHVGHRRQLN